MSGKYVIGLSHTTKLHLMPKQVVVYVNLDYSKNARTVNISVSDILYLYQTVIHLSVN